MDEELADEENVYLVRYAELVTRIDEETRKLFQFLANEERKHLKQFETEYEDLQNSYN